MSERRSNRAKSNINYSKYVGDDDDDFADPTPPMRKLKNDIENSDKSVQQKEKPSITDRKSKSRKPPPEDRLLELQIKKAVAASLKVSCGDNQTIVKDDDDSCFLVNDKPLSTSTQKDPGKDSKMKNGDEIEIISSTTVSDSPPRKRQKTTSRYNCIDSDSDYDKDSTHSAESDVSDDDEFDPDNKDVDFNSHKKSQIKSKKNTIQDNTVKKVIKSPVLKSTVKTPKSVSKLKPKLPSTPTLTINTPGVSSSAGTLTPNSTPLSRTPASLPRKIPSWTPPGPAGKNSGESIKSPGGIRIGLSRQQRVKTLHPSLTVQP